ncbi:MAG: AAA family ATPase [Oligoflexales bacterium]|nr:AAA family ATPase [Oligoflexales bacterium]
MDLLTTNTQYKASTHPCRIVLTGGPGGGKTTAADLFRREIGDRVVIVPEAATLLFSGGFPRVIEVHAVRSLQQAIFHVQRNLEDVQSFSYQDRILLCDRGTVDGAAYWPAGNGNFFESVGTTIEAELSRYDAVIYFESAAVGGIQIEGGNPARIESLKEAVQLDMKLRELWSKHKNFEFIPHQASFLQKISFALDAMKRIIVKVNGRSHEKPLLT